MTAISASSVRVKTLSDGTLRLEVDIEPMSAQEAFRLFGSPGTHIALAALKVGTPLPQAVKDKPKGGPLAQWAAMRCNDARFCEWFDTHTPELTAERIRAICKIESRAELDSNAAAAAIFRAQVMQPWSAYCVQMGWD